MQMKSLTTGDRLFGTRKSLRAKSLQATGLKRKAFSLIEIMIVLAIIVMISGLVGFALLSRRDEATVQKAQIDIETLKNGLLDFNRRYGRY
ncbi:MAG: prepilin-type N-terminal cleavage/methylation domain-containing protein, partial [Phycisphaerales bacterium]|nr:prepilin-type N-terminal cleavage/methylation domain-containing protein [Phycisphaerales bacterium]